MKRLMVIGVLLLFGVICYAQEPEVHTLFIGEFENRADIENPLLNYLNDTLSFLFSRSQLAKINPTSAGLRSAYLQWARNEQPDSDATQITLLAAEHAGANVVLMGSYTKTGDQWTMEARLYMIRGGGRAREDIQLAGDSVYSLLDNLAGEVSKRLGAGQYTLLSTKSWEAYEYYRQGHSSYYNFDLMGAMNQFQKAIELDPRLAIAQAELGISYAMMSMVNDAHAIFEKAMNNRQYASEHEQLVVMGLESFYRYYWVLKSGGGGLAGADIPRMREDKVWDEPWLHRYIGIVSEDKVISNRGRKEWLLSAMAYAEAGFYGVSELADAGTNDCISGFDSSGDPQFLEAAIQFITQAADMEANDEYDDAWKNWELANIYEKMSKTVDAQDHRKQWLQAIKSKPLDNLPPDALNDLAGKCLKMGASGDALEFAAKAVELEHNIDERMSYTVTLADAHLASGELAKAFDSYIEAFGVSQRGDASTSVLSNSLSGLAQLVIAHSEFMDEARRTKLNEVMDAIGDMDPISLRAYSAGYTLYSGGVFENIREFCHAMGDMGPVLKIVRGLLNEETKPVEQLVYLSALVAFNGGVSKFEQERLSSPEFIKALADQGNMMNLAWVYEVTGERRKAVEAYEAALKSGTPEAFTIASCALISLHRNLGEGAATQSHAYFEAEEAENLTPYFEIAEASETSGGRYIWAPDTFDGSHNGQGSAEYTFEIAQPGTYSLLARMLGEMAYANCVRVSIGDNEFDLGVRSKIGPGWVEAGRDTTASTGESATVLGSGGKYAAWEWVPASDNFRLPAGKHRLVIHSKDDGVKLDCMVLYREGESR
jgi:tetratricopeptide (TPR) repeat protein